LIRGVDAARFKIVGTTERQTNSAGRRGVLIGALLGALAVAGSAHAAPVEASITVAATPKAVMAWLADGPRTMRLSPDVETARVVSVEPNGCVLLDVATRGLVSSMHYRTRRCNRTDGFEERLVRSEDLDRIVTTWSVRATAAGTRIRLSIDVEPSFYVPEWMVDDATQDSVDEMVKLLGRALASQSADP
jgi:hypothetical protein